jgi:hypothetical protein
MHHTPTRILFNAAKAKSVAVFFIALPAAAKSNGTQPH